MNEIKDAILRMVKTALFLKKMADAYCVIGLDDNPHHNAYGDLCDAIYYLVGEHTEDYNKSVTCLAVSAPFLTDERRTELLWSEYVRHHPDVYVTPPKPFTISPEELRKMTKKNGGYMAPEGDWT